MASTSAERVSDYRERLRRSGLRPVELWVPDTRDPNFAAEAQRQSRAVAEADRQSDIFEFLDDIQDFDE